MQLAKLAAIPIFVTAVAIGLVFFLDPLGTWTFNPPNLTLLLNAIFLTGTGVVVAAVSARSYIRNGDFNILLLGTAALVAGFASLAAGRVLTVQTANYSVTIHNIGFFVSSILQILSAALIFSGARLTGLAKRRVTLVIFYSLMTIFVVALTALTLLNLTPTFFGVEGSTLLRQSVVALTIIFFSASCLIFFRSFLQSKSPVLYWYSLALGLFAIGFLSLTLQVQAGDSYSWISKVAQYAGGIYFIIAVLSSRTQEVSEGGTGNWAEAFRSDRIQFATLFSKMLNGFSYQRIILNDEDKPVDYVFLATNEAFEKMTGLKRETVTGKKATEVLPGIEKDPADWIGVYGKVALTGQSITFENYSEPLHKWYSVSAYCPRKGYFVTILEDITEHKKAEEELKRSERLYHSIFDNSQDGFQLVELMYDKGKVVDFKFLRVNSAYERQTGLKAEFVQGKRAKEFAPNLEQYWFEAYEEVDKTGEAMHMENYNTSLNRWFDVYQFSYAKGQIGSLFRDITEHKKLEKLFEERTKKLELSSLYARNLIEASLDPLVTISLEGKITDVNKATEIVTECSREELIGSDFSDYFTEPEKANAGYKQVFKEGFVRDYPLSIQSKSGKITNVLYNATVYNSEVGEIQGVFAAARDVTELKKAEEQAQEAAKKLKDSERLAAIGATAGMVGHDIRNPLQAITSDVFLAKTELASTPESEEKKNALESMQEIEKNVDYINKIVQDLQDYARPLNPNPREADLKLIIDKLVQKNGLPKNVKVSVEVEDEARKFVADADYLTRILYNLVTNAVQAMPKGGKLTILVHKEAADIVISVKDTGVGIPKDVQSKMFTVMFTTKSKGQGFGLPVVKRMTESLGGTVTFESIEGKGTTFIVRLPSKTRFPEDLSIG